MRNVIGWPRKVFAAPTGWILGAKAIKVFTLFTCNDLLIDLI